MTMSVINSTENNSSQALSQLESIKMPAAVVEAPSNNAKVAAEKAANIEAVDTVTLQDKSQKTNSETRAEKAVKANNNKATAKLAKDVLFDYNARGDLRIKFMDSRNKLIYQTPPVLFAKIIDLMNKPQAVVDTKI